MKRFSSIVIFFISITIGNTYASFLEFDNEAEFTHGFYGALSVGSNWANADWSGLSSISLINDNTAISSHGLFESWTPTGKLCVS